MEAILATMKVPVTEVTTLDKPIALKFAELVSKIWIILLLWNLTKFIIDTRLQSILIGRMVKTSLNPLKLMINVHEPTANSVNQKDKGKEW